MSEPNHCEANTKIVTLIGIVVLKYPQLRFEQILSALDLKGNGFYEDSSLTLSKIEGLVRTRFNIK